jgi:signal transduction histidine kinase
MVDANLIDRLAGLPKFCEIPPNELEWLVAHGQFEVHEIGTVLGPKGIPLKKLWIILSGCIAVRVDRGAGPRLVIEWRSGDVSGMLPYSRMIAPPGNNYVAEECELLSISTTVFKEMIQLCPKFTAYTVHLMLDRARSFKTSDLQDEKMISLGKLAAGLAHELNNPASAVLSNARMLLPELAKANSASRALGVAKLSNDLLNTIEEVRSTCLKKNSVKILSPLERTSREDEIADWLAEHNIEASYTPIIAEISLTINELNELAKKLSGETLIASIQWIATGCTLDMLASDIEKAASKISDLVAAVKRFTYMDNLGKSELADVETSLSDTIRVIASKAKLKSASIELDLEKNLPKVQAVGSDLNQVWMNLIDNALDAISESGKVKISAHLEQNRVIVSISDNGPGIPQDIISKIFDPFFTTKPPGQGTGLGLDIARRIVNCYRGDINVRSQNGLTEFRVGLLVK